MKSIIQVFALVLVLVSATTWAQPPNSAFTQIQSVPTLDELGMAGLIVAIGVLAGWIVRNRRK